MNKQYDDLEKISSVIFPLGNNLTFKMNVRLSSRNRDGNKQMYYNEVRYFNNKYNDKKKLTNINLTPSYYLSLESIKGNDTFIKITNYSLPPFKKVLKEMLYWIYYKEPRKPGLFVYMDGKLILNKELVYKEKISLSCYFQDNKKIIMTPTVFEDINGTRSEAILFTIENQSYYILVDAFEALYDILSNFNMYQSAMTMISIIGRPEFGQYQFDFESTKYDDYEPKEFDKCTFKSKKKPNEMKGFFD